MIENAPDSPAVTTRRYAPPISNQRNRPLSRRKSGDRFERTNNPYGNEGEKIQRNNTPPTIVDHGEAAGSSNVLNENPPPGLINIDGCCRSEAAQLLTDRWVAVVHSYNDPTIDLSERPVMYSGAGSSAWGHSRLTPQMDFLTELRRAICNANANLDA